jgi:hypothetical protein
MFFRHFVHFLLQRVVLLGRTLQLRVKILGSRQDDIDYVREAKAAFSALLKVVEKLVRDNELPGVLAQHLMDRQSKLDVSDAIA